MTHYAIKRCGSQEYLCLFPSKKDRDAKIGANPDFSYISGKDARRAVLNSRSSDLHSADTYAYVHVTRNNGRIVCAR